MHTTEQLEAVRKYRLGQAEERGIIDAARSWLTLPRNAYGTARAEFIDDAGTIAAECRDGHVRVWFDPNAAAFNAALVTTTSMPRDYEVKPAVTPESHLVLEVVQELRPVDFDYVLEGYVPGDWEVTFFKHVSSLLLERRLNQRTSAIISEQREQEQRAKLMRRWDV